MVGLHQVCSELQGLSAMGLVSPTLEVLLEAEH